VAIDSNLAKRNYLLSLSIIQQHYSNDNRIFKLYVRTIYLIKLSLISYNTYLKIINIFENFEFIVPSEYVHLFHASHIPVKLQLRRTLGLTNLDHLAEIGPVPVAL